MARQKLSVEDATEQLTSFMGALQDADSKISRAEGELIQVEGTFKNFGAKDIKAAERLSGSLARKREKLEGQIVSAVTKLNEDFEIPEEAND